MNSMQSNSTTSPSSRVALPRCRSPWHSRIAPLAARVASSGSRRLMLASVQARARHRAGAGPGVTEQRADLLEVLPHRRDDGLRRAQWIKSAGTAGCGRGSWRSAGPGRRYAPGQLATCLHGTGAAGSAGTGAFSAVFDGRAATAQLRRASLAAGDRQHLGGTEPSGQALVEAQFLAEMLALEAGEVEEAEIHRLLIL